jgi:peptide/nickel transport system substrate-binding protein
MLAAACGQSGSGVTTTTVAPSSTTVAPVTPTTPAPTTSTTTTAPAVPQRGGTVVIADDQEPRTLNPYMPGGDDAVVAVVGQAHLAGVYDIDPVTRAPIPELVTELPSVGNGGVVINDDGTMTVRWQIRDDAVWSDGEPVSGADFEFTLEFREGITECAAIDDGFTVDFGEVESVGDKTFSFRFDEPGLKYEQLFPWIVPRHAVAGSDFCNDWNDRTWPAAGPFVLDEWGQHDHLRFVRNDNYWKVDPATGSRLPYLDAVEFRFIPETEEIMHAFSRGEVDVIQPPPSPRTIAALEQMVPDGAGVQVVRGPVWEHLNFQFGPADRNPDSLNRFTAFRRAVAYAVDREVLAADVGWLPISSIYPGQAGPWAQYTLDPARAVELLGTACDLAGRDCAARPPRLIFSTTSNADERPRIAEMLASMLGEIGIDVELQLEDSQVFFGETLTRGTWDLGWWAWVRLPGASGRAAVLDLFDPDAPPPDGANYYRWGTPDSSVHDEAVEQIRSILQQVRVAVDRDEVESLTQEAEQILADNAVVIPVAARLMVGAVWADEIAGYVMNPTQAGHTWNIEAWYRVDL